MPTREPLPPIISCDPEPRHICYDGTEVALSGYIDKNGEVRCDFVCGKPTPPAPSTPPNGCYYQEVQCIKTPCEPILVCPTPTTPPQPQILKNTPLIRLTFHLNNLPASEGLVQSSISFAETSVVSSEVDSSIVDFGAELRLNISKTPPPTADPGTSISCRPAVFKLPFTKDSPEYQDIISGNNTFLGQMHMNNRINEEDNYVTVKAGDLLLYVPEITNTSSQYISTMTDQGLLFTMSGVNESPEYQYLIYPSSRCTLDSSGRKGECREDISIEPGVTKMLNSSHLVTEIRPGSSGATSFYQFTFNRQDCGLFRTEMSSPKEGDLNGDGNVDLFDYQELITNFGNPWTIFDYQKIIANYGN